jgi:flagellar biosynthesis component FlhA
MRRMQPWQYLIGVFAVFWIIFAIVLFLGDIPFFVISIALTTIAALSLLVVLLAWAYQNNL